MTFARKIAPKECRLADEIVPTSPPYNLAIRYAKFCDNQNRESYLNWAVNAQRKFGAS
jgi:hypothetical protein